MCGEKMSKVYFMFKDDDFYIHHLLTKSPTLQDEKTYKSLQQMHAHENYELFLMLKGDCTFLIEGTEYPLQPGSIVLMRPAEVHCLKINSDTACERIALNFEPKLIKEIDPKGKLLKSFTDRSLGAFNVYNPSEFSHNISSHIMNMTENDIVLEPYDRKLRILVNLLPLLNEINSAFLRRNHTLEEDFTSSELLTYINDNITADLSLESLGEVFFLSKSQLNRSFRKLTGTTIWKYIVAKRLIMAREMILAGSSAYEACYECGFKDYSTFFRAYKNKFGLSPSRHSAKSLINL